MNGARSGKAYSSARHDLGQLVRGAEEDVVELTDREIALYVVVSSTDKPDRQDPEFLTLLPISFWAKHTLAGAWVV